MAENSMIVAGYEWVHDEDTPLNENGARWSAIGAKISVVKDGPWRVIVHLPGGDAMVDESSNLESAMCIAIVHAPRAKMVWEHQAGTIYETADGRGRVELQGTTWAGFIREGDDWFEVCTRQPRSAAAKSIVEIRLGAPTSKGGSKGPEADDRPAYYGGEDNPYEVFKVAEAWDLDQDAYLFTVLKYIARGGKKPGEPLLKDLKKAAVYLNRRIQSLEGEADGA